MTFQTCTLLLLLCTRGEYEKCHAGLFHTKTDKKTYLNHNESGPITVSCSIVKSSTRYLNVMMDMKN